MRRPTQPPPSKSGSQDAAADLPGNDGGRQAERLEASKTPPAEAENRRGRQAAARPAGRIREDRRRAEPGAGQPGRKHAVKRLKAASRHQFKIGGRIGDQVSAVFGVEALQGRLGPGEGAWTSCRDAGRQGQQGRLDHHGRHARVLRAPAVPAFQDGARRDAAARRRRQPAAARRRPEQGKRPVDRPVRVLVRHAGPLGRRPGRSRRQRHVQRASRRAACRRRWCSKRCRSSKAKSTCARTRGSPSRRGRRSRRQDYKLQADQLSGTRRAWSTASTSSARRFASFPTARANSATRSACSARFPAVMQEAAGDPGPARNRQPGDRARRPRRSSCCLQSKRINPKGGGGGGSTPGGGGGGKTLDSALALFGGGVNEKEVREDRGVSQATGESGSALPEEFRAGLDEYFNRLERGSGGR